MMEKNIQGIEDSMVKKNRGMQKLGMYEMLRGLQVVECS